MTYYIWGFEVGQQCELGYVLYDAHDEMGPLNSPSQSEWIVPGTVVDG